MSILFHPAAYPLELGFLSPHNPYDRRAFSGTSFFAARALAAHPGINLRILGPHQPPGRFDRLLRRTATPVRVADMALDGLDAVLGLAATPLLNDLADRRPDLPLLHVTDATPLFLREAYGWTIPLEADRREARLAARAAATIYSSPEMARRAPGDLGLPGLKPISQPFGINLETLPGHCPQKPSLNKVNLLFVGIDWQRKGGDIAVQALDQLRADGLDAELTLVGKPPEHLRRHPGVKFVGFLDKNRPRDAAELTRLYHAAHFLILPARADCTPMVVAEAMAHGTPVLAAETGGVASLLGGAGTGQVLPASAGSKLWAKAIQDLVSTPEAYAMTSEAAFDRASTGLNWQVWAEGLHRIAQDTRMPERAKIGAA